MDNSIISSYTQAVNAQSAQLQSVLDKGFGTISVPASISQIESSEMHFLGKSGVVFLVIGVIALVAGLIVGSMGWIITGAAGLLSGGYLLVKGKQARRSDAFDSLSEKIYAEISVIADKVSSQWQSFASVQNDNLKKQIVGSTDSTDSKVALIDKIEKSPEMDINLAGMQSDIDALASKEDLNQYKAYVAKAENEIKTVINNTTGAQQSIYTTMGN